MLVFFSLQRSLWFKTIKPETFVAGFRKTGVHPLDLSAISIPASIYSLNMSDHSNPTDNSSIFNSSWETLMTSWQERKNLCSRNYQLLFLLLTTPHLIRSCCFKEGMKMDMIFSQIVIISIGFVTFILDA